MRNECLVMLNMNMLRIFIKDSGKIMVEIKIVDNEWVLLKKLVKRYNLFRKYLSIFFVILEIWLSIRNS